MKKIFSFVIVALLFSVLTGCGDDGVNLSGTYNKVIPEGEKSYSTKLVFEKNKSEYLVKIVFGKAETMNMGVMKKNGDFLVKSDNIQTKMFQIKNNGNELVSLYTSEPSTYLKQEN